MPAMVGFHPQEVGVLTYLAGSRLVENVSELDLPMNPCRQHVLEQCREQGACILSKEEFESVFLFSAAASNQRLSRFCLENDLELVVDVEARQFTFRAGQPEDRDSWSYECGVGIRDPVAHQNG